MDNIIVLKGGEIVERGSYAELLEGEGAFSEFLIHHRREEGTDDNGGASSAAASTSMAAEELDLDTSEQEEDGGDAGRILIHS